MWGNQFKTVLFLGILTGLLLAIGQFLGGTSGLTIALILALLMNLGSYFYSHKLILKIYRAKLLSHSDNPQLHEMIEDLAKKANIPKPKLYLVPTDNPNAFAAGPNPKKAVVAVTQGILNILDKDELNGVIAHEIAHIKNRDILISTIAATIASVISYVAFMARWGAMFGGFGGDRDDSGNIIGLLVMAIIAPLAAMMIQLAISRSREFIADASGAKYIGNGKPLADALHKLESHGKDHPLKLGQQSTNSMFIINPFRGRGQSFLHLFLTHPPTSKRVERLNKMSF